MAGLQPQLLLLLLLLVASCNAALALHPLSQTDKDAAKQLFVARDDGSFGSLEETYQALTSLKALKIADYDGAKILKGVSKSLVSSSPDVKDIFYGLRIIELLHGKEGATTGAAVVPKVLAAVKAAKSLVDLYFSVGALATIKKHHWSEDSHHKFAPAVSGVLAQVKALGDGNGAWRYAEDQFDTSVKAAGLAFDITAGVIEIAGLERHKSDVKAIKNAAGKIFEKIEHYDDGAQYFDESKADKVSGSGGSLAATAAILHGVSALASVLPDGLKVREDNIFGLASFFLSFGAPSTSTEAYYQLDALSILEDNRLLVPLAVHLPSYVLSITSHDNLEVIVSTVLGSPAPEVVVTLVSAHESGKEDSPVVDSQELEAVKGGGRYTLDFYSKSPKVGKYDLKLEVKPVSAELSYKYSAGGLTAAHIITTGFVSVSNVELAVVDSDTGTPESVTLLDFTKRDTAKLSANHLQKFRISFELTSPSGGSYHPQQVFFKLSHESGVEHLFVVAPSGKLFELTLDFLGLLEKLYYMSGKYTFEVTVGDLLMENSFLWPLGSLDLDLPDIPDGAKSPPATVDNLSKFGPKPEIEHIFRKPEKRPASQLSYAFLILTLLPLIGFLVGLLAVGTNVKYFPTSGLQLGSAVGFSVGIAAILTLYFFFWLKLNLFVTLKVLGFLGVFTCFTGHFILSHLADLSSSKMKMA